MKNRYGRCNERRMVDPADRIFSGPALKGDAAKRELAAGLARLSALDCEEEFTDENGKYWVHKLTGVIRREGEN